MDQLGPIANIIFSGSQGSGNIRSEEKIERFENIYYAKAFSVLKTNCAHLKQKYLLYCADVELFRSKSEAFNHTKILKKKLERVSKYCTVFISYLNHFLPLTFAC